MKRLVIAVLCGIGGYVVSAVTSYFLVTQASSNVHDRAMEAAMTSAFVWGPLGAVVALVAGFVGGASGGGRSAK